MSRIISVEYDVKVYCEVDVENGTIVRVVEHSDNIEQSGRFFAGSSRHDDDDYYVSAEEVDMAIKIAEDQDWPAWERGY